MRRFYAHHLGEGRAPAQALAAAQGWLREVTVGELVSVLRAYGHWLGREHFGPLEFYRVVLERGRVLTVEDPDHAIKALQELLDGLGALRHPGFDDSAVQDLLVVALVILARAHLERLNHVACEEYLKRARKELRKSSGNREIEASLLETWAALARAQGNTTQALTRLKQAERLLEGWDVQQRYSEVLARQGLLLVQNGFASQGATVLEQAYTSLPNPSYPRLRLEIRHFQAVAAVQLLKFDQALYYLSSAKTLYDIYASLEPMATQRLWLLGLSYPRPFSLPTHWKSPRPSLRASLRGSSLKTADARPVDQG